MADLEKLLKAANDRLQTTGLKIFKRNNKLSLRGSLPAPDGKGKKQTTIALDVYFNAAGIKRAEAEALKISSAIALKEFTWSDYRPQEIQSENIGFWIDRFEEDYFNRRARNPKSETTYRTEYGAVFKWLDRSAPMSADYLLEIILSQPPDTRQRQRYCMVLGALANLAGIDFNPTPYRGDYSPRRVNPRLLPSDEEILEIYKAIDNPGWQYVYGLMATYGVRNFEVFHIDMEGLKKAPGVIWVLDDKKAGRIRQVWPFYPEWWERFELYNVELLPQVSGKNNSDLGNRVTKAFNRLGILKPYNLRHCWARRTLELGLDVTLAAQQMGHAVDVHTDVYHHWIGERVHQKAFEQIRAKRLPKN